ncbi:hypothetical protein [Deinococcus cellulosilyticus]|uniref:Uncharacterized protein n=1 Tax=Deinococcus cellulosilyticus (strain DSM 18568 / NBRC 106333 / KACC 11606 / 5516J-15) TaxID=1223518 RepID=A0A511N3P3_DEIC1|nr:hypothetical protein [Deinococcus cellulosilyticus]GEM47494.1 hypothetical protein DC3_31290 [Deinococcus cellulosilyticus NBRC 106333 = KACC 11606]
MTFNPQWNTQDHLDAVMQLLERQESASSEDIRKVLNCPPVAAHSVLEELIAQGFVQTVGKTSAIRYIKRAFDHDMDLVHEEWFDRLIEWFAGGRAESHFSVASQLGLNAREGKATLEEMRRRGMLFGKFVGSMCIYSLRERGMTRHASGAELEQLVSTPRKQRQEALQEALQKPKARPARARGLKN